MPTAPVVMVSAIIAYMAFRTQKHLAIAKNTIDFQTAYTISESVLDAEKIIRTQIRTMSSEEIAGLGAMKSQALLELVDSSSKTAQALDNFTRETLAALEAQGNVQIQCGAGQDSVALAEAQLKLSRFADVCREGFTLEAAAQMKTAGQLNEAIKVVLNSWEKVAIAIQNDVYSDRMLYQAYGTTLISFWNILNPYIRARQKELGNPRLYISFSWLALRWKLKRDSFTSEEERRAFAAACQLIEGVYLRDQSFWAGVYSRLLHFRYSRVKVDD
jgi:hypothetical protein